MFLNIRKFNADFIESGGENPLAGFDVFLPDDMKTGTAPIKQEVVTPVDPKTPVVDDKKPKQDTPAAKKEDEKPDVVIDEKAGDDKAKTEEEKDEEIKFRLPGEEEAEAKGEFKEPEKWSDAAKFLELEDAEKVESFETFHERISKHIEKVELETEAKTLEKIKTQTTQEIAALLEINPVAKEIVDFVNQGGDLDEYLYPAREVSKYLALSDEDLIKQNMLATTDRTGKPLFSEDEVETEINGLIETGRLGIEGKKLRAELEATVEDTQKATLARQLEFKEHQKVVQQKKDEQYRESVKVALSSIDNLMGGQITQKHRDFLMGELEAGRFSGKFDDPKEMAEFMVWNKFGDQLSKQLKKTQYQNGRDRIQDKLVNVPPTLTPSGAAKKAVTPESKGEGDFSAWGAGLSSLTPGTVLR